MKLPASALATARQQLIDSTAPAASLVKPADNARKSRAGGVEARQQLLMTALKLFSEKGFAKTYTRAIAEAAGVNMASISYYFGDKASLYRAMFNEPIIGPEQHIALFDQPHLSMRQSLQGFISGFLEPMKQGELVQQCMRLHFREMLEPTGVWTHEIDKGIKPAHAALLAMLGRHLGVAKADDELHRLRLADAAARRAGATTVPVVRAAAAHQRRGCRRVSAPQRPPDRPDALVAAAGRSAAG